MAETGTAQAARREAPTLSVVVPTKGRPHYLDGCLAALGEARYPRDRFEVVIVNDGGGGETERVVERHAERLRARVERPARSGPSAARNAGAWAARGRYVAFTDDDCEPAPGWLAALERALGEHPGAAAGGVTVNGAPDNPGAVATQIVVEALHESFNRDPAGPRFFASSNLAFPAGAFREIGGFDEGFRYAEDREMCRRWVKSGHRFVHAPDAVVHHMRTLSLREFWGQHHGYGRGAWAFHRSDLDRPGERAHVVRALASAALRLRRNDNPVTTAAYIALSQVATASGFAREAAGERLGSRRLGDDGPPDERRQGRRRPVIVGREP